MALVLAFPVSESSRNQIIGLIGLLLSGIIAFSSSTIFANLMAGIMLRVTRPFGTGDFVSVNGHFGRVVERGLLDTEIQTEDRELVAFPNTSLITNPVTVVRSSGTIVSVKLSLGYDIHHSRIETLLLDAVKECGLDEPFVQILELGNFAVTYKASGMLVDTKTLLTARSNLCRAVLDTLIRDNRVTIDDIWARAHRQFEAGRTGPAKLTLAALPAGQTADAKALDMVIAHGHSRIPVYHETIDQIIGILYAKDLLRGLRSGQRDGPRSAATALAALALAGWHARSLLKASPSAGLRVS